MTEASLSLAKRRLLVVIVISSSFLSVLMQFLLLTAFPKIMEEFNVSSIEVQWLTTSFMVTVAILIPMTAFLMDRFKSNILLIVAMALFLLGTIIGWIAPSFFVLLVGRIFQGMGSGIMVPLMQTILYLVYPKEKRGYAMGLAGMVINVAPAIGPPLSGIIIRYFEWRALFFLTVPITVIILLFIIFFMKNVTNQRPTKVDPGSIFLSTIGFGGLLYGFNQLQEIGFMHISTFLSLGLGVIALILFILRQLRLDTPILEIRVLAVPVFSLVAIITIIGFSLLIAIETILPLYVQNAQQFSAYYGGMVVMPGALTLAVTSLLAGHLFDQYGGRIISIVGFIILLISTVLSYFLLELDTPFVVTMLLFMLAMSGMGLINMPIMTEGINALPDDLIPHGTSVINTIRQFGGTIGLTFIISFISRAEGDSAEINPVNYLAGVKSAFLVSSMITVCGLLLSFFIQRRKDQSIKRAVKEEVL